MGRKANGEGTVTKLPSGKYRYRDWVEIDGIKQRKSFTASSPTAARNAYRAWMSSNEKVAIEKVKTVKEWALHWLEIYKKPNVSWKVHKDYKMYVDKQIIPAIGALKIADVRPAHIAQLYANAKTQAGKALTRSSLEKIKIALHGIFDTAIDNGFCTKNPMAKVGLPEKIQKEVGVFTKGQIEAVVSYIDKHEYGPYIAIMLYTGLRVGEMLGLTWADVDTENKLFIVRRTLKRTKDGERVCAGTKTKRERVIPYDDALGKYIEKIPQRGLYVISRELKGVYTHHTYRSFCLLYYSFFDELNSARKESLPRMTPHKFRHTFATYMLKSGVDIRYVQALLGHTRISTTEIYTHVNTDDIRANISKLKY